MNYINYRQLLSSSHATCAFIHDTPPVHSVDLILKPFKAMCSLFRQVDEQASDSDIPAITCPVTVGDESLPEGSTSRRQSLFVRQEDSEESDEGSSLDNESQVQLNRFIQLRDVSPVRHTLSVPWEYKRTSVLNADIYGELNNVYLHCLMSLGA